MLNAKEETRKLLATPLYVIITLYCGGIFMLVLMIMSPSGFDEQDSKFIIFLAYAFLVVRLRLVQQYHEQTSGNERNDFQLRLVNRNGVPWEMF